MNKESTELTHEDVKNNTLPDMPESEMPHVKAPPSRENPWDTMVPLKAAINIAMYNAVFLLSRYNRTISAKAARAKYGGHVDEWVRKGYVVPIPTKNGRIVKYSESVLAELWRQHVRGYID